MDMRAITMKGALISEAILRGYKTVENRTWVIKPGWYALHTGSGKIEAPTLLNITQNWPQGVSIPINLPTGVIVGFIYIDSSTRITEPSGWATGPVLNHITKVIRLPDPIKAKGQLGLWKLPRHILQELCEIKRLTLLNINE